MPPPAAGNASARGFFHESDDVTVRFVLAVAYNQITTIYHVLYLAAPVLQNEVSIDTKLQATLLNRQLKTGTVNPGWGGRTKVVLDVV